MILGSAASNVKLLDYLDGCEGGAYYDFSDVPNICEGNCSCSAKACDYFNLYPDYPKCGGSIEVGIASTADDAEEGASGAVDLNSSDLELVDEDSNQLVGLRFSGMDIPWGSTITDAYIQFQVDEKSLAATSLMIFGEAVDDASIFDSASWGISSRMKTAAAVGWEPPPWLQAGEQGPDQQSPDLSSIIQEIMDRPGWSRDNSLVIIIAGFGKRVAESYNGDRTGAPLLHVEYCTDIVK